MFSTRVLQTVSLVSGLDSRILIRLGALRYVTAMLLRRWAWLILSDPVTSSRIRPIASGSHIDDVTIAKLLTFEIISGAARNERYGFHFSKTTCRFNYK